jgi:hypothetical protein
MTDVADDETRPRPIPGHGGDHVQLGLTWRRFDSPCRSETRPQTHHVGKVKPQVKRPPSDEAAGPCRGQVPQRMGNSLHQRQYRHSRGRRLLAATAAQAVRGANLVEATYAVLSARPGGPPTNRSRPRQHAPPSECTTGFASVARPKSYTSSHRRSCKHSAHPYRGDHRPSGSHRPSSPGPNDGPGRTTQDEPQDQGPDNKNLPACNRRRGCLCTRQNRRSDALTGFTSTTCSTSSANSRTPPTTDSTLRRSQQCCATSTASTTKTLVVGLRARVTAWRTDLLEEPE